MICCNCKQDKSYKEFNGRKDRKNPHTRCKECQKQYRQEYWLKNGKKYATRSYEQREKYKKQYKEKYHSIAIEERQRKNFLENLRRFKISEEEYNILISKQCGVCAICGKENTCGRRLAIDHCHTTGKIRGLLCSKCNSALGVFNDSREMLSKAIDYLNNPPMESTVK